MVNCIKTSWKAYGCNYCIADCVCTDEPEIYTINLKVTPLSLSAAVSLAGVQMGVYVEYY